MKSTRRRKPLSPEEFVRLVPPGMRVYPRTAEEVAAGENDRERFQRWRAAWRAWCAAAGVSSLDVFRAVHWSYMPGECPWQLPTPARTPDPTVGPWAEWIEYVERRRRERR
ncbi:hypothetical protein [Geodermatophilus chilensis]|uniref:hypothetical protein n=1 Tax=Geodermatophilus chilensis TaxID=2035835 RepID=UPI000C256079|nr:hypothetical protein [Geodermatophilus chilensis]